MSKNLGAKPMLVPQPVMMIGTYDADGNANQYGSCCRTDSTDL